MGGEAVQRVEPQMLLDTWAGPMRWPFPIRLVTEMIVRTVNILPTALSLDDHVWDPREGVAAWVPIVALSRNGGFVEVTLECDPEPLRLPARSPIQVHRHVEPTRFGDDDAPGQPEVAGEVTDDLAQLYVGDLSALREAARAHRARVAAQPSAETPATAALRPLVSMYGGDLELVLEAIAGVAPDEVLTAARKAAMSLASSRHGTAGPVLDEQATNEANQSVEDRLGGWYPGDLGALLPKSQ